MLRIKRADLLTHAGQGFAPCRGGAGKSAGYVPHPCYAKQGRRHGSETFTPSRGVHSRASLKNSPAFESPIAQREGQEASLEGARQRRFRCPSLGSDQDARGGSDGRGDSRRGGAGRQLVASCRLDADGLDVEFKSRKPDKASLGIPAGRTKQNGSVVRIDLHFIESAFRTSAPFVL